MRAGVLLLLCSCTLLDLSFEGSACATDHPCPGALVCDLTELRCVKAFDAGGMTSCPVDAGFVVTCARHDYFLSPDAGDDAHDGKSAATAWATLGPHVLSPGDRVNLLPGDYAALGTAQGSGSGSCPVELLGPDAGVATLRGPMEISQDGWWLHDFDISVSGTDTSLRMFFHDNIRLERLHFHNTFDGTASPRDIETNSIHHFRIVGCTFDSIQSELLLISFGSDVALEKNHFIGHDAHLQLPIGTVVRENDFTGTWLDGVIIGDGDAGIVVERNVFHEVLQGFGNDFDVVSGAASVTSNTFINIDTGRAASTGVFRDNIVSSLRAGSGMPSAGSGYNLFDAVAKPYASGDAGVGDVFGAPMLDVSYVPSAGSPAVDAADPALAVPLGGGSRADIGANERGGTVCSPGP